MTVWRLRLGALSGSISQGRPPFRAGAAVLRELFALRSDFFGLEYRTQPALRQRRGVSPLPRMFFCSSLAQPRPYVDQRHRSKVADSYRSRRGVTCFIIPHECIPSRCLVPIESRRQRRIETNDRLSEFGLLGKG
jgi:hypothetical protein